MRNKERRFAAHGFGIRLIQAAFRQRIERGGGFIQKDEGRVAIQRAGKQQLLHLAAGKFHAIIKNCAAKLAVHPLRQGGDFLP